MWTKERDYALAFAVGLGLTRSQTAQSLGISRNAVIGRVHRLGLSNPNGARSIMKQTSSRPLTLAEIVNGAAAKPVTTVPRAWPGRRRTWTDEKVSALRRRYTSGLSDKQISEELGISRSSVMNKRHELGLLKTQPGRWPEDEVATLAQMLADGASYIEIGRRLKRSKHAVAQKAKDLGLIETRKITRFSQEEDDILRNDFATHVPVEDIAKKLKRTYGTVHQRIFRLGLKRDGRKTRLAKRFGVSALTLSDDPVEIKRILDQQDKEEKEKIIAENKAKVAQALELMQSAIDGGAPRKEAFQAAMLAGATLNDIGEISGITRERVRQIVHGVKPRYYYRPQRPKKKKCRACGVKFMAIGRRFYCDEHRARRGIPERGVVGRPRLTPEEKLLKQYKPHELAAVIAAANKILQQQNTEQVSVKTENKESEVRSDTATG